jgi:hypothetical protein
LPRFTAASQPVIVAPPPIFFIGFSPRFESKQHPAQNGRV